MELQQKKAIHEIVGEDNLNYFKYFSDDNNVIDGIFKFHKIRFTQPWCLNDPFEFNPRSKFKSYENKHMSYLIGDDIYPGDELWYRIKYIESQINAYGILSLTKITDSFDMWSRYSNGHKGFLIEFKFGFENTDFMKSKTGESYPINKIEYVYDYCIDIDDIIENKLSKENVLDYLFFKKTNRWEREQEYRIVRPLKDCKYYQGPLQNTSHRDDRIYLFDFPLDCIATITFGAYMSIENKTLIMKCCENYPIEFLQVFITRDNKDSQNKLGNISLMPIDQFQSIDVFLNLKPQTFCMDYELFARLAENGVKEVSSIQELPYYKDEDRNLFEEYIQNRRSRISKESRRT
jgi:hypothetical protein